MNVKISNPMNVTQVAIVDPMANRVRPITYVLYARPKSAAKTKLGASPNIVGLIVIPVNCITKLILGALRGPLFYSANIPGRINDFSADGIQFFNGQ